MAEESIATLLNQVWSDFRRAGITDDLRIIETIAALLLEQEGIRLTEGLPYKASSSDLDEQTIKNNLRRLSKQVGAAKLFDRYVLFRLSGMLKGGRYFTPRHIIHFMSKLIKTARLGYSAVADFACGSGGFLIIPRVRFLLH